MNNLKQERTTNTHFIWQLIKPMIINNRRLVAVFFALSILASIMEGASLGLVMPLVEGFKGQSSSLSVSFPFSLISGFFNGMNMVERIRWVAGVLFVITALKGLALYFNNIYVSRLQIGFMKYYRMKCFSQFVKVGMEYINKQKAAYLQTTAISYTFSLGALITIMGRLISKLFIIGVLLTMLLLLSWRMTFISLFIVTLVTVILRKIAQRTEKAGKEYTASLKGINWSILDAIQGMKIIRLFRREADMTDRFESEVDKVNESLFKLSKRKGSIQPLFESLGMMSLAVILVAGSFLLLSSARPQGLEVIFTFIVIFVRVLSPAMTFNQARVAIRGDLPSYREVADFINIHDKPYILGGKKKIEEFYGNIEFRDVSFKYSTRDINALNNISFKIPRGAKIGIVGSSGSGKSTIIELLLRFYDLQKGKIIIDGVELKDLDLYSWRSRVGVVTQDTFLFHDTVGANIAYANPKAAEAEIEAAARQAYAHNFIKQLPEGYNTVVGDRGVLLSGGQKQRIAIARAVLMDPDIFVFDEATSSLDTESEEIVQKALYEVSKGKTVITIAHRLSTVYDSDIIIVLDEGRIIGQGKHSELLAQDGIYRKLVRMQAMNASSKEDAGEISGITNNQETIGNPEHSRGGLNL